MTSHIYYLISIAALSIAALGVWYLTGGLDDELTEAEIDAALAHEALPYKIPATDTPCAAACNLDSVKCCCQFYVEPVGSPCPHRGEQTTASTGRGAGRVVERDSTNDGLEYW